MTRRSILTVLKSITLPLRHHAHQRVLIKHTARAQAHLLLPFRERAGKDIAHRLVLAVEGLANQQIVEIPATLLFPTKGPGQVISQLRVFGGRVSKSW